MFIQVILRYLDKKEKTKGQLKKGQFKDIFTTLP